MEIKRRVFDCISAFVNSDKLLKYSWILDRKYYCIVRFRIADARLTEYAYKITMYWSINIHIKKERIYMVYLFKKETNYD